MATHNTLGSLFTAIANSIRSKTGQTGEIIADNFPDEINAIETDPSVGDTVSNNNQILNGLTCHSNGVKYTGSIQSLGATTYNTSTSDQTIAAGQYLSGAQTIKGVSTSNISAGNIKHGVNVKVGDANSDGRIVNVTGSFYNDGTTYTLSSTGTSIDMGASSSNRYITTSGLYKPTSTKAATTYNTSTSDQTIASGTYLTGAQTIKAVTTSNIAAGNIKKGVAVKVGDANSAGRIANVTGTFAPSPYAEIQHFNEGGGTFTSATFSARDVHHIYAFADAYPNTLGNATNKFELYVNGAWETIYNTAFNYNQKSWATRKVIDFELTGYKSATRARFTHSLGGLASAEYTIVVC